MFLYFYFIASTHNENNFQAILQYKTKYIEFLNSHFKSDTRYKTYMSPQIQNGILNSCLQPYIGFMHYVLKFFQSPIALHK